MHELWKTVCSEINISFLIVSSFKLLETLTLKRLLEKKKKSILHRLRIKQIYGEDFIYKTFSTC